MAAEFYKTSYSSSSAKKRGRSFAGFVVDSIVFVVTVAVVALFRSVCVCSGADAHALLDYPLEGVDCRCYDNLFAVRSAQPFIVL